MILLDVCDNPNVLTVVKVIKYIIAILRIAVPIILIVMIMVDFMKATSSEKESALKDASTMAVKRTIAAMLVFFIPTFLNLIFDIAGSDDKGYSVCLNHATDEYIAIAQIKQAQSFVDNVNKTLVRGDYNKAIDEVNKVKDEAEKKRMQKELKVILKKIEEKEEEARKKAEEARRRTNRGGGGSQGNNGEVVDLPVSAQGFAWPLNVHANITACVAGADSIHRGNHGAVDVAAPGGTPVYAAKAGTISSTNAPGPYPSTPKNVTNASQCGSFGGCGNYVVINHGDGTTTKYCHLYPGTLIFSTGQYVQQGQQIGAVGTSGCSTGNHLHYAITYNGSIVDPLKYSPLTYVNNPGICR